MKSLRYARVTDAITSEVLKRCDAILLTAHDARRLRCEKGEPR